MLELVLDRESGVPLYRQIVELIEAGVRGGRLPVGARLPATRALAASLGVGRQTVLAAYEELQVSGRVTGHVGRGTFLCACERREATPPAEGRTCAPPGRN